LYVNYNNHLVCKYKVSWDLSTSSPSSRLMTQPSSRRSKGIQTTPTHVKDTTMCMCFSTFTIRSADDAASVIQLGFGRNHKNREKQKCDEKVKEKSIRLRAVTTVHASRGSRQRGGVRQLWRFVFRAVGVFGSGKCFLTPIRSHE
jgi:hypothetical protein